MIHGEGLHVYKIGGGKRAPYWKNPWHVDRWFRSWQAEIDGMVWAARAWTKKGAQRKIIRWYKRGTDIRKHEKRYGPNPYLWTRRRQSL